MFADTCVIREAVLRDMAGNGGQVSFKCELNSWLRNLGLSFVDAKI